MNRQELIEAIRTKQKVKFRDVLYIPQAYILRLKDNKWFHSVELRELRGNFIVIADLNKIEELTP